MALQGRKACRIVTEKPWFEPSVLLRAPSMFNLRRGPCQRADVTSDTYWD